MPRKSAASLSVAPVAGSIAGVRLSPPKHLSKPAQAAWLEIVGACPPGFFDRASVPLLEALAHATSEHRRLSGILESTDLLDDLAKLSRLIATHASVIANCSTKLRLTNQSRYNPRQAANAQQGMSYADRLRQNYGV